MVKHKTLQICWNVRTSTNALYSPNYIDPKNPAKSMYSYYLKLKDNMIWGTDEPWTKNINYKKTYSDEVKVIADLFKLSPEAMIRITIKNSERFLFG